MERTSPCVQASQVSMENPATELTYAHRPKPLAGAMKLRLTDDQIIGERGAKQQAIVLSKLARIRLRYSPRNTSRHAFTCEITAIDGRGLSFDNISWKSLMETERLDKDYRTFVQALVAHAARANPDVHLEAGVTPFRYRLVQISGAFLLAGLAGSALVAGLNKSLIVAGFAIALGVYLGVWLKDFITRNRPRKFTASTVPESVLPDRDHDAF
jgi:hypothetical protein